jgi:Mg-chelatase subunit ChlD
MFFDQPFGRGAYSFADDTPIDRSEPLPQPEEETIAIGPLTLSTRLEYTSLKKDEAYNVFALVSLHAAEAQTGGDTAASTPDAGDRAQIDITCVLDVSGSMTGSKIALVKEAVMFVIDEMQPGDRLSIVSFNHGAQRLTPLTCMDVAGKDTARQSTLRLTAGGGTSIAAGLDCGIQVMEQRRQRNTVGAVFLLTDGQDSTSPAQVQELVKRARAAQCGVYAFGFGQDHDTTTLSAIAEAAQTPFTYVEDPSAIKQAFAGAVGGLMSVAAQNIELRIAPDAGCTIKSLHTHFEHRSEDGGAAVVSIPDAFAGERRDVVVELSVPAASADNMETPLLCTSARYRSIQERALVQVPEVPLHAVRTEEPEGEPDEEVTTQRHRIEVSNALEEAISQGEQGRFADAQRMLDENIEKVSSSKSQNNVSKALLAELSDARCRLSSAADWNDGGHAELTDAMWMHRHQRCTNFSASKSNRLSKCSKQLYISPAQRSSIARLG